MCGVLYDLNVVFRIRLLGRLLIVMLNRKMVKKIVIRLGLLLALVFLLLVFDTVGGPEIIKYTLDNDDQKDLSFSFSSCDEDSSSWVNRVESQEWVGNQLVIKGTVYPNCGASWLFGSYELDGDKLSLNYKPAIGYFVACECKKNVTYTIDNIPKREYSVSFNEKEPLVFYPLINKVLYGE